MFVSVVIVIGGVCVVSVIFIVYVKDEVLLGLGLEIIIEGVCNSNGKVFVLVIDIVVVYVVSDYDNLVGYFEILVLFGVVFVFFLDLIDGFYVVVVVYDENGNCDLDMIGLVLLEGYVMFGV